MADDIVIPAMQYIQQDNVSPDLYKGNQITIQNAPADFKTTVDFSKLNPDLSERLSAANKAWKENKELNPTGSDLPITSKDRNYKEQAKLYLDWIASGKQGNLVAPPGRSKHETFNAVDMHPSVPDSFLGTFGLYRPYGAKDAVHVEVNPKAEFHNEKPMEESDIQIPAMKYINGEYVEPKAEPWYKTFGKQASSTADVALGAVPAGAQFVAEPFAKLIDRVGDTKIAEEALSKLTNYFDKPVGKAFGLTQDPAYNAEGARQIMNFASENADKGAEYIADKTGMSKSDAQWFINAALLKSAPTVGKVAKTTGQAIGKIATAENAGNLLSEISGKLTSSDPYAIKRSFEAGKEKNPAILEASKEGAVSGQELVNNVREAFENVKESRKQAYRKNIQTTKGNQVFLDFKPIREAFDQTVESLKSKNLGAEESKVGSKTMNVVNDIKSILDDWESKPELHTAGNLDDLKQRIDDVYENSMNNNQKRIIRETRNAVKDTIVKQDKNYEKTMADYEKGLELEREISRSLGLGDKVAVETTIRKLAQVFSKKGGLSNQYRMELLKELEKVGGKDIIDKLAGYSMSKNMPGAMQLLADIGIGIGAHVVSPEAGLTALGTLAVAQSPKLALYGAYGAGRSARAISDIKQAAQQQVAKGKTKLSEITSRK
jgi:hypothetical protein